MRATHHHTSATLIGFVAMITLGCNGSTGPPTGPTTGAIHITVSTVGANADLDTDGYIITVDGRAPWPIGVQGAVTIVDLAPGTHFVTINGLASNCSVAPNKRWVDVVAGGLAQQVAYNVECHSRSTGDDCGWDCYYWSQSSPAIEVRHRER